ncbi:hypothetical protein BLX41_13325 [Pseudomonas protegens]|uniref:DUF3829 domain-containing protein n=1 Tax=Pseudomonas protegens TaxID=380021 RepID=UPI000FF7278B|nr:DUF3829 domain-containing protein [Pseudomonas protegens]ROL77129.1 hypothetical protein BLX41_13325 [Pseudomonas protegens]
MSQRPLLIFGCALIFGLFALLGAGAPIARFELWLAGLDSAASAQAAARAPLIDCVNQYDVPWRLGYYTYGTQPAWRMAFADLLNNAKDFADGAKTDMDTLPTRDCEPRMLYRLRHLQPDAPLIGLAERYIDALHQANLARRAHSSAVPGAYMPAEEDTATVALLKPKFDHYLQASAELRDALASADIGARREQQRLLEQRLGQDIHWHLLDYMIQARLTVEQISQGMREKTLTPEQLAQASQDLQQAWDAGQPLRNRPQSSRTQPAHYLWSQITRPAQRYQQALLALHQDWHKQADPQRLSEDYHAVMRAYDSLLSYYNKQAQMDY